MNELTIAELRARATELERQAEVQNLSIPGVQQRRSWALRKRYLQQASDYLLLVEYAEDRVRRSRKPGGE